MQAWIYEWIVDLIYLLLLEMLIGAWDEKMFSLMSNAGELVQKGKRRYDLRPRSPKTCRSCRLQQHIAIQEPMAPRPWKEVKSRRGRPKQYDSDGYACINQQCPYYKITDAAVHALRHDGTRNQCEATSTWECGYCGQKRTAWFGTPQYRLKTCSEEVGRAFHLSMKGMSISDISEVLGYPAPTIQRWLDRGGRHSEKLHRHLLKRLCVHHIQLDELVSKVRRYARRVWIWTGIDVQSKLLIAWTVGGRSQQDANWLVHQIARRLHPSKIPAFTSDGLNQYFYALTAHFGDWLVVEGKRKPVWQVAPTLLYGQFRKLRAGYRLKRVYTRMMIGQRADMRRHLQGIGLSGAIQTAIVERLNLTLRHLVAALRRRTWALANSSRSLRLRFALGAAYYNFCRPHQGLQNTGKRHQTPAMAAGLTTHRWTVREFLLHPVY